MIEADQLNDSENLEAYGVTLSNVRDVYEIGPERWACTVNLHSQGEASPEPVKFIADKSDKSVTAQWVVSRIESGHGGVIGTLAAYEARNKADLDLKWASKPADERKADLAAYAARRRWQMEVAGAEYGGWLVHTDRESQAKIAQESKAIDKGFRQDGDVWKFADGVFRALTNAEFQELEATVYRHVKGIYALEAHALRGIEDGSLATPSDVDDLFA